ncbi:MAG: polymer-forming cytoskeletal protein [Gammaproteobacteria bacterium]|nr:polymer-forming cytoskeletal protein [Gammaproteobacteria bacterium]NIR83252.1 polymer-forming cytoskeletal protein [Gammaproteobacteria bacterium]NIR91056.1 polymer-forming cytoskeletal protein [Gammaproteobacteria bacterium]NIU04417.1 polymer-forming cytoskeletal protein [Gammaproteobacteria bacterium]NIV76372.1 hypothetical protein [Gammaproteobacteria bacterium]
MWQKRTSEASGSEARIGRTDAGHGDARDVPIIGRSIVIRGDVTGGESIVIRGRVEGNVLLPDKNVFVDPEGRVTGDIHAQIIRVEGYVEGRLWGKQRVVIRSTARVTGDILSPRITLEDGCRYSGKIDTEATSDGFRNTKGEPASARSYPGAETQLASSNPLRLARATGSDTKPM